MRVDHKQRIHKKKKQKEIRRSENFINKLRSSLLLEGNPKTNRKKNQSKDVMKSEQN